MAAYIGLENNDFSSSSFLAPVEATLSDEFRRFITEIRLKDAVNISDMIRVNQFIG